MASRQLTTAGVVLVIAITPTLFDAWDAWEKHPEIRFALILWYLFAIYVACSAWRMFTNSGGK